MVERDYFRGDQKGGVTAPDLSKQCEYADHVVNARGKKTAFTSISLDRSKSSLLVRSIISYYAKRR